MKSLMATYDLVHDRANGVCEGEGCSERHLEPAKTYEGKVLLLPNHKRGRIVNDPDLMLMLCQKCSGSLDRKKHAKARARSPKKRVKRSNQIELFELTGGGK